MVSNPFLHHGKETGTEVCIDHNKIIEALADLHVCPHLLELLYLLEVSLLYNRMLFLDQVANDKPWLDALLCNLFGLMPLYNMIF